jgi:uncharacterized protein YggT (Ycf19 family)
MIFTFLQFLYILSEIYMYVFLFYILLSYFNLSEDNPLVKITDSLCTPVQNFFLRILPPIRIGMFDLSPLYVFIFLQIVQIILQSLMNNYR